MRYLGIDFGTKHIGIALSDEAGTMGFPRGVLPNDERLLTTVREFIAKEDVSAIVIGESKNLQGGDNAVATDAKKFAALLAESSGLPVHFEPEHFSTQQARRTIEGEARGDLGRVDASAAALILTSYLGRHDNNR